MASRVEPRADRWVQGARKRAFDVAQALVGFVLAAPLVLFAAVAIVLTMGRPVLFRQPRLGRGEKPFVMYKLRTMAVGRAIEQTYAGGLGQPKKAWTTGNRLGSFGSSGAAPTSDSYRITRLGRLLRRWSIDELPQLWNVLRGEMSLVGPRPLPLDYLDRYTSRQRRRHEVKPGITGWAQVRGRNQTSWEQRFELDLWYVEHASLGLDLRIVARSAAIVFSGAGVSPRGAGLMPEFLGERNNAA